MLRVEGISKSYNKKTNAVEDFSMTVEDGTIGILMGPNGAGKSTVIKCICSLLNYEGRIEVDGHQNASIEGRRALGYAPEIPIAFGSLTVLENIEFIARAYSVEVSLEQIMSYLEMFDLQDKKNEFAQELSKGMTQKLSIIMALIIQPSVLLLDEPFIGLDPKAIRRLKTLLIELKNKGTSVLISTHMIDTVKELYDKAIIMKAGRLAAIFDRYQVGEDEIEEVFFKITEGGQVEN